METELIVNEPVTEAAPRVPVRVATVWEATDLVVTVNVAVVAPPATVTLAGTVADAELLARVTLSPAVGATAFRVTVPVELAPPRTLVGLRVTLLITGALTVRLPFTVTVPAVALIVATV